MPDNTTECNEGTKVCQQGDCKGSICLKYGLEQVDRVDMNQCI